jgi:SAM-dependent methyltransferase
MPEKTSSSGGAGAVTPERLYQFAWGFAQPLIIEAAVRNGFFDALAGGPLSLKALADKTRASERGVRAAMDALVGIGLAARDAEGRYQLTPESEAFLVSSRPGYQGGFFRHISEHLLPHWLSVSECVKTGEPAQLVNAQKRGAEFFRDFVEDIFPMSYPSATVLAKSLGFPETARPNLLDIAAGSGVWGIAFAKAYPQARVCAVDWEGVMPVTKRVAERHGVADRFEFVPGDILEAPFGNGFDVATLGHILHSEGDERSRELLGRVFDALKPGGTIAIAEFLVSDDRTEPPIPLIFSVNMLVNTRTGRAFSFAEISAWLRSAGFTNVRALDAPGPSPLILATKPQAS